MTKKILLIIGILIIVGVAAFLIFSSRAPLAPGQSRVGFSISNFLPFGNSGNSGTTTATTENGANQGGGNFASTTANQPIPRLRKISNEPIAGAVIFDTGTTSIVRFEEKGTGNVYEARSDSNNITRLTNTTIPKIIRAFWLPDASGFLAQTLLDSSEVIETSFVKLNKNTASTSAESLTPFSVTIGKLPTGIKEIAVKPDSTKIFYYTISNGFSSWYVSNPDGTKSNLVESFPLTEWIPQWISGNQVIMQNKASYDVISFSYSFDVSSKILKKIGLGMVGLSVNPNSDGSLSLASSGGSFPQLSLIDNKNVTSTNIQAFTLAEKCVWTKDKSPTVYCAIPNQTPPGNYPDIWYQGLVSTDDFISKIDLSGNTFYNVSNLSSESGEKIDVENLSLSPDGAYLIFKNKIDGYLWMLRIEK